MKQDTLEGRAKTKNGVKRLCFSAVCILLEAAFIIAMITNCYDHKAESICGDYQSDDKASCRCTGS